MKFIVKKLRWSYAQNGPKSTSLYLSAKINAAEFDWLILANQTRQHGQACQSTAPAEKKYWPK